MEVFMRYVMCGFQALTLTMVLMLASACTPGSQISSEIAPEITGTTDAGGGIKKSSMDVNKYPVTKTVCDPFGDNPDPRSNQGLKAELWWLEAGQSPTGNVGGLIAKGKKSDRSLFFAALNTPTRMFDLGFASETGDTVKSDAGQMLIENFALRFKSILRLAPNQKETKYEFAVLSDDGAILTLRDADGVYRTNVNNDGDHPTRLGCGTSPVDMKADTELPMSLDYYQGPRYHISLVVLMREYKADRAGNVNGHDPACGVSGNSTWFDPNHGSMPQKAYTDLLARGWQPLTKDNFALGNEVLFNPCKDGVAPLITNFQILERFIDGFSVSWTTDIPATDAVVVTDPSGAQTSTVSDNILRTSHLVRVTGLQANTNYGLQGVSISDTYGRTVTPVMNSRTDY
jgi:hypothetical protein